MKNHLLNLPILIFLIILVSSPFIIYRPEKQEPDKNKKVYIEKTDTGYQLIRNGQPFYIRGAGGNMHLDELAQMGGNTIRLYDTTQVAELLDEAHRNNLAVIIDIPLPRYSKVYKYYSDEEENRLLRQNIRSLVNKHKDHPALLMWNLGNELYYPLVFRKNDFIRTYNSLIEIIKEEDPNHPVTTAMPGVARLSAASIFIHSPKLDLLAYNIFSDTPNLHSKLKQLSVLFGRRPYFISEFGSNGPWESGITSWNAPIEPTSSQKTEQIKQRYSIILENRDGGCLGTLAFYWGNKLERTYTWFSYYFEDYKSEMVAALEALWRDMETPARQFNVRDIHIGGKSAKDNLIFAPYELKVSEIEIDLPDENFEIKWEIYEETWPWAWSSRQDSSFKLFNPRKTIDSFVNIEGSTASFLTPEKEGPYRIFAFVYDQKGYFATANLPFYILAKK